MTCVVVEVGSGGFPFSSDSKVGYLLMSIGKCPVDVDIAAKTFVSISSSDMTISDFALGIIGNIFLDGLMVISSSGSESTVMVGSKSIVAVNVKTIITDMRITFFTAALTNTVHFGLPCSAARVFKLAG